VTVRALRWFFFATGVSFFLASLHGMLSNGQRYAFNFVDIDGHKLSTADGHVTVLVLATTRDSEKVRAVGDSVPDHCLGNSRYKMITIVHFTRKYTAIGRGIATAFLRHRVKEEARRLQARYDAKKIMRDARSDILTVTDFDGTALSQLGGQTEAANFHVFVFSESGELLHQWSSVPGAADLAAALK
jgi:rhamnose utilization protein RhaD (predicted bifunctional aldolase and dehydrogenase)